MSFSRPHPEKILSSRIQCLVSGQGQPRLFGYSSGWKILTCSCHRDCHSSSLSLTIKSAPHGYIYESSQCVNMLSFSGDGCDACTMVSALGTCKIMVFAIKHGPACRLKIQCVCVCVVKRFRVTPGDV